MKIALTIWTKGSVAGLLAGCLFIGSTLPARAGLGADASSIDSDAAAMLRQSTVKLTDQSPAYAPTVSSEQSATYSVKSFVTPDGVTVREYVAPSGTVFGVGWQGHRPPDLSILFGSYFGEYMSASQAARHKDLHRSRVVGPDSVVVMSGHMGRVQGRAWVPSLIPSGVDPQVVVK